MVAGLEVSEPRGAPKAAGWLASAWLRSVVCPQQVLRE